MPHQPRSIGKTPTITNVLLSALKKYPGNPRCWTDKQKSDVTQSLRRYGCVDPVLLSGAKRNYNTILGGHLRAECARALGWTHIPAIYISIRDPKKERELVIRLNKNTGSWDYELLKSFDVDLLLEVGFDDADLGKIWDDALSIEDDHFDVGKAVAAIKKPKAKIGDLYQIGPHRLIVGDSRDPEVIRRLVGKHRIDMLYSDPPYNISLRYDTGLTNKKNYGGSTKDNLPEAEYRTLLKSALANGLAACKKDCHVFTYIDQQNVGLLQALYIELGVQPRRTCLYIKNNMNLTPQIGFSKCYEPCLYGTRGDPYLSSRAQNYTEILNREIGNGNRTIEDILDLIDLWLCKRLPTQDYTHPTEKSPTLHERPLRRCTRTGDKVLDLFAGSGSTAVSAHMMKRTCFLSEWDPVFADVILRRFEETFGIHSSLLRS
jgi:DNA modification methylase